MSGPPKVRGLLPEYIGDFQKTDGNRVSKIPLTAKIVGQGSQTFLRNEIEKGLRAVYGRENMHRELHQAFETVVYLVMWCMF